MAGDGGDDGNNAAAGPATTGGNKEHAAESGGRAEKKNRPKDTRFHQQRLPAWQPILTAGTVIPSFVLVGLTFIPFGGILLWGSESIKENVTDYTNCTRTNGAGGNGSELCSDWLRRHIDRQSGDENCTCSVQITLADDYQGDIFFFYGLDNFYQNHRRYVKSRNDEQLTGELAKISDCQPFDKHNGVPIAPCGAVANSMFTDTFQLKDSSGEPVPMTYKDVAWPVDSERKFNNPPAKNLQELQDAFKGYAKPPNWRKNVWELDTKNLDNNGFRNVDFMVWMRTAALPNFRKLYRRLDSSSTTWQYKGLRKGTYTLEIVYEYPVVQFEGRKRFIISTQSWLGAKNNFLGVAYVVVGVLCAVLAVVFFVVHRQFGKGLADMSAVRAEGQAAGAQ